MGRYTRPAGIKAALSIGVLPTSETPLRFAKEALIEEMVCICNRDFVHNQGEKHSNTSSIASIFNDGYGQNNIADACQRFNQHFPKAQPQEGAWKIGGVRVA